MLQGLLLFHLFWSGWLVGRHLLFLLLLFQEGVVVVGIREEKYEIMMGGEGGLEEGDVAFKKRGQNPTLYLSSPPPPEKKEPRCPNITSTRAG